MPAHWLLLCCAELREVRGQIVLPAQVEPQSRDNKNKNKQKTKLKGRTPADNMNKVDAPCRPSASLKFTIDNILNLKTSGRSSVSCHPAGQHHEPATYLPGDGVLGRPEESLTPQEQQDAASRLQESGKSFLMFFFATSPATTTITIHGSKLKRSYRKAHRCHSKSEKLCHSAHRFDYGLQQADGIGHRKPRGRALQGGRGALRQRRQQLRRQQLPHGRCCLH